jgi:hypothetical protein
MTKIKSPTRLRFARIGMDKNEKVNELARRRGFLWPAFELYGGAALRISGGNSL